MSVIEIESFFCDIYHSLQLRSSFSNGLLSQLAFRNILVGTIIAENLALVIAFDMNFNRNVADTAFGEEDAMFQFGAVMLIGRGEGLFDRGADHRDILRVDKVLGIVGRGYLVSAHPLSGCMKDRIEMIVEGKTVAFNIVF